jgi:hypothetical protein
MLANVGGLTYPGNRRMEPYGGVKYCLEGGSRCCKEAIHPTAESTDRAASMLGATYWLGIDLPLCIAADTLTLAWTVPAVLKGEAICRPVDWGGGRRWLYVAPDVPPESDNGDEPVQIE